MDMTNIISDAITASRRANTTTDIRPSFPEDHAECLETLLVECNDYFEEHDYCVFWGDDWQVRLHLYSEY